ncbi:MAG: transglutaminase family protein [Planctomycetales bacterium]|nr:transglutaminase family protein [Planctomycetales bacterium]
MKYKITHATRYTYSEPVPVCHNQLHLAPRDLDYQFCYDYSLLLSPAPHDRRSRVDYFGNLVDYFSIHEPHQGLTVTSVSVLEVLPGAPVEPLSSPPWEEVAERTLRTVSPAGLAVQQFRFPSRYMPELQPYEAYARQSFTAGRPIVDAALDLTSRIHRDFRYDPRATHVNSTLAEVFQGRAGVCQDFAHLQAACMRSIGLAARYVSGYLRTLPPPGKPRLVGADASHAWVSLWCGTAGWVDFDPTNNTIPALDHVTLAWGRDYSDVCPIQGVVVGGGQHEMSVTVDVEAL